MPRNGENDFPLSLNIGNNEPIVFAHAVDDGVNNEEVEQQHLSLHPSTMNHV